MKSLTPTTPRAARHAIDGATVEIGLDGRREALDLMATLASFHSFIVQHDCEHWVVHARVPGGNDENLADLLTRLEQWRSRVALSRVTYVRGDSVVTHTDLTDTNDEGERS